MVKRRTLGFRRATSNQRSVYGNKKLIIVKQNEKPFYEPEKSNAPDRRQKPYKGMRITELEIKAELTRSYGHIERKALRTFIAVNFLRKDC